MVRLAAPHGYRNRARRDLNSECTEPYRRRIVETDQAFPQVKKPGAPYHKTELSQMCGQA
jgi:hypothetical protein